MVFIFLGQSDVYENGSSGDTSEDVMFDIQNPRRSEISIQQGLWSNSSRLISFTFLCVVNVLIGLQPLSCVDWMVRKSKLERKKF